MFILLPPSEGKSPEPGNTLFSDVFPDFARDTAKAIRHIKKLKVSERAKFYGLGQPQKTKAAHSLTTAALDAPGIPALERYTGVVYDHIDFPGLRQKDAARKRVLVVSALFGLIPGGASIPDYKLSMNSWLARYWIQINAQRLKQRAEDKPVLDLLSQSYRKAVTYPGLVTVDFKVQGGKKAAGHFGKAIKGRFVRWLLENEIDQISDFRGFTEDGYRFDGQNFIQD